MIDAVVEWMGGHFSPEAYLFWTRVQCLAWTAADVVIVFFLIRLANLGRELLDVRGHVVPYWVLAATLPPVAGVVLAPHGRAIFGWELLVTVPHFVLILYLLAANLRHAPDVLRMLVEGGARKRGRLAGQKRHSTRA